MPIGVGPVVPNNDLLTAIHRGLVIVAHLAIEFGGNAPMNPGVLHYGYGGVTIEVADLVPGSMTWADLTATLVGIQLFTADFGYSGRTFKILTHADVWVGFGGFYLDEGPTSPPAGLNRFSRTA